MHTDIQMSDGLIDLSINKYLVAAFQFSFMCSSGSFKIFLPFSEADTNGGGRGEVV